MAAENTVGQMVKSSAPEPAHFRSDNIPGALNHFPRGFIGERQQQYVPGFNALGDKMRQAIDQRPGLAGAGRGEHQQRAVRRADSGKLLGIEVMFKISRHS